MKKTDKVTVKVTCRYCGCHAELHVGKKEAFLDELPEHICASCGRDDGFVRAAPDPEGR